MLHVTTLSRAPRIPKAKLVALTAAALGKEYEVSLVFISSPLSRTLNRTYREKDAPANVLSFALSKSEGEIFIDRDIVKTRDEVIAMFIHGLAHLKGLTHGSIMEAQEKKLRAKWQKILSRE